MREMLHQILAKFKNKVEAKHEEEFQEQLYLNNLERAYLISVIGVVSLFFVTLGSIIADKSDAILNGFVFLTHAVLCFVLVPTFFVHTSKAKQSSFLALYGNRKLLFFITLGILSFSLLPLAVASLQTRNSIILFAIFIIIANLGFKLPQRINIVVNLLSLLAVSLGIIYVLSDREGISVYPYLFEIWALSMTVFLIASYQFQNEIVQFNYGKVLEEKNELIKNEVEAQFSRKIAEIEMTALRAQMNPHFLFNVLNSIKLYMVQNDARTASRYLTKFSRLIRLILNNSKVSMVTLEEELNALKLYIEMENFRFNDKFDYELNVEEGVSTGSVKIPPMVLQPYVENAIWHGLMHKEQERGLLSMTVRQDDQNSGLLFIIEDNGIGRERAMQIRTRTANKHKSVGMQITQDRIAIANKLFNTNATVEVIDLKEDGQATGTRVVLHLPVKEATDEEVVPSTATVS
ncbi:MAG: histidine kinase [Bacteroidota bacterium]